MSAVSQIVGFVRRFFDADYKPEHLQNQEQDRFDFGRLMPILVLHLGCLGVIWVGFSWTAFFVALGLYFVRMFAITAFYHRYFAHRSFRTSRTMQFLFAALANTAMQRGPLWWASTHRHHHSHSDEEPDAHSPVQRSLLWSHIGWLTSPKNTTTDYSKVKDLAKFPELVFLNRFHSVVPLLFAIGLWGLGAALNALFPGLGTSGAQIFVWGFFISTTVLLHGTLLVNSLAHVSGKRRFKTSDDSRNNLFIAIVTLGEGWHNNHHRYPHSTRQGFYWFEIDVTFYLLKMMEWMRLIKDLKRVPDHIYEEARQIAAAEQ